MTPSASAAPDPAPATARDPVCGMAVTPGQARGGSATHDGREYWFCSPRCRERFVADPARYATASGAAAPAAALYTCPMHPEIRRPGPGECPICGMALEPVIAAADEADNPELRDMSRRLWVSAALTAPLVAQSMAEMLGAPI